MTYQKQLPGISLILPAVLLFAALWQACADPNQTAPNTPAATAAPNDLNNAEPNQSPSQGDLFNKIFEPILTQYVNDRGYVAYAGLRRHRLELRAVLAQLAILDPDEYLAWTKNEKIAFWINVHNILMLDIIIENYPIESRRFDRLWWPPSSIRHIPPRDIVGTPKWNGYKFIIMDEEFTLYEIENRFFREQFRDPRIFLALSMGAVDGPPLKNAPYYGTNLDRQLNEQAKRFLSTPGGVNIDRRADNVSLSVIFEPKLPWYGNEFLPAYGTDKKFKSQTPQMAAVLNFICNYLGPADVAYLETADYSLTFKAFDWRVNQQ
jgi:hypothetical protein